VPPYEMMLVLDPLIEDAGANKAVELVTDAVTAAGGTLTSVGQLADRKGNVTEVEDGEGWRARRLAYPISGRKEAFYAVLRFDAPGDFVAQIESRLRLEENVLRFLTLRDDDESGEV